MMDGAKPDGKTRRKEHDEELALAATPENLF